MNLQKNSEGGLRILRLFLDVGELNPLLRSNHSIQTDQHPQLLVFAAGEDTIGNVGTVTLFGGAAKEGTAAYLIYHPASKHRSFQDHFCLHSVGGWQVFAILFYSACCCVFLDDL
jgi:hypothetical protein